MSTPIPNGRVIFACNDFGYFYTRVCHSEEEYKDLKDRSRARRATLAKPLGGKAYGSIPHLPHSRQGSGEHRIHKGQAVLCLEQCRKNDRVIVTEKMDGSNCTIARLDGVIYPLTRSGYPAWTSPYCQHHAFARWVMAREQLWMDFLSDDETLHGEWMLQAHGTRYMGLMSPFIVFDMKHCGRHLLWEEIKNRADVIGLPTVFVLSDGEALSLAEAKGRLLMYGRTVHHRDRNEGVVYRVETENHFNYLTKFVYPDKEYGTYLPEITGEGPVYNTFHMTDWFTEGDWTLLGVDNLGQVVVN